jgi:TonB family protein
VSAAQDELRLLVAWPNPVVVFAGNLIDRIFGRVVPGLVTTSEPDHCFWRDVDLRTPFPLRGLLDSAFAHAALLGLLYAVSIWPQSTAHLAETLSQRALNRYTLSKYLPELHGTPTHPRSNGKLAPVLAKQEILSLPETPDNLRQTIVSPPKIILKRDIDLPNIVANEPAPPLQPLAASQNNATGLHLPRFMPEVVGPTADTSLLRSSTKLPAFEPRITEPAPDVASAKPRLALPAFQPDVAGPAPDLSGVNRKATANLAHLAPRIAEPVPETPNVAETQRASRQIIVLSRHPAEVHGPVELPSGNRRGVFAASPNGQPEAAGLPGTDALAGTGERESQAPVNAPPGLHVIGAAPAAPVAAPNAPTLTVGVADPDARAKFMAAMRPPATSLPPRQPIAREATEPRSELENRLFAGKRSYTLSVNMPNLNTATGSWIIHFAERAPGTEHSPIAAPEIVSKFDPAYPSDLIHDGVQGTVILTATIRADGSVGDISIAKSLDPRLDQNAAEALSRWFFRPALRNGRAIDLEAVITVPFRAKFTGFR